MKLRQFVPGMLRTTQGMRTGPETSSTAPRDLLPGLQRFVEMVVYPDGSKRDIYGGGRELAGESWFCTIGPEADRLWANGVLRSSLQQMHLKSRLDSQK